MITQEAILDIMRDAIYAVIICSAPLLLVSLVIGCECVSDHYLDSGADLNLCSQNTGSVYYINVSRFVADG